MTQVKRLADLVVQRLVLHARLVAAAAASKAAAGLLKLLPTPELGNHGLHALLCSWTIGISRKVKVV